jgi:hypothetical protein
MHYVIACGSTTTQSDRDGGGSDAETTGDATVGNLVLPDAHRANDTRDEFPGDRAFIPDVARDVTSTDAKSTDVKSTDGNPTDTRDGTPVANLLVVPPMDH